MVAGVALVPEDRRQQGLVLDIGVARNVTLSIRRMLAKLGFITSGVENAPLASGLAGSRSRPTRSTPRPARSRGGNQQKVVLAKWLADRAELLIVDEPTRGIDVGTKAEMHRLLPSSPARASPSS